MWNSDEEAMFCNLYSEVSVIDSQKSETYVSGPINCVREYQKIYQNLKIKKFRMYNIRWCGEKMQYLGFRTDFEIIRSW